MAESVSVSIAFDLRLKVLDWDAWAEGRAGKDAWQRWAREAPAFGLADGPPALAGKGPAAAAVPAMLRRRAGLSDRLALEPACGLAAKDARLPCVFASRHGQIVRSVGLLEDLARGVPLSPMDFSVSVHNATAGLFSIARGDRSAATALAAGRESFSAALLEAQAMLQEGAEKALLVYHDETPPHALDGTWDGEPADWSLALLLGRDEGSVLDMRLEDDPARGGGDPRPQAYALVRLLAKGAGREQWHHGRHLWTWEIPS
jgi:hypothetical protein